MLRPNFPIIGKVGAFYLHTSSPFANPNIERARFKLSNNTAAMDTHKKHQCIQIVGDCHNKETLSSLC